jgi:hypothetical protein
VNLHDSTVSLHTYRLYTMTRIRKNIQGWTFLALYLEEKVWRGEHKLGQLFLLFLPGREGVEKLALAGPPALPAVSSVPTWKRRCGEASTSWASSSASCFFCFYLEEKVWRS